MIIPLMPIVAIHQEPVLNNQQKVTLAADDLQTFPEPPADITKRNPGTPAGKLATVS